MNKLKKMYEFLIKVNEDKEVIVFQRNNSETVLASLKSIVIVEKENEISFQCALTQKNEI